MLSVFVQLLGPRMHAAAEFYSKIYYAPAYRKSQALKQWSPLKTRQSRSNKIFWINYPTILFPAAFRNHSPTFPRINYDILKFDRHVISAHEDSFSSRRLPDEFLTRSNTPIILLAAASNYLWTGVSQQRSIAVVFFPSSVQFCE